MTTPPQGAPPTVPVGYGPAPARYAEGGPHLSPQRARVLDDLQLARTAVTVEETATRLALHTNTARNHLEALVEVRPPEGAESTYRTPEETEWARSWPMEEIWRCVKTS